MIATGGPVDLGEGIILIIFYQEKFYLLHTARLNLKCDETWSEL